MAERARRRGNKSASTKNKAAKTDRTTTDLYGDDYNNRNSDSGGLRVLNTSGYDDVKWYSVKEGKNEIDIVPYEVKTKNHPKGRQPGQLDYKLIVWVHRFVGGGKDSVLCLKKTFGKACPICEEMQRMIDSDEYTYQDKEVKKLKPSERVFYNVIDLLGDSDEVQLLESSTYEFQKELIEEAEAGKDADGEYIPFAELAGGYSVKFRGSEREGEFKGSKSYKPKGFKFVERDDYDEDILDESFPLDEMLVIPTYDEVKKLADGVYSEDEETEDDEMPSRRERTKNRRTSKRADNEEADGEEADGEEADERPSKRNRKAKNKVAECPCGGKFGEDTDTLDECDECDLWKECTKAFEK